MTTKKIPTGCKTPSRERQGYSLTSKDIAFMMNAAKRIDEMLTYYTTMPENRTGALLVNFHNEQSLESLQDLLFSIQGTLDDVWFPA